MKGQIVRGTVEGTGAAINVELGFTPIYVKCWNIDDAGSLGPSIEWVEGMGAASGLKTLSIVDNGTTTEKSSELLSSLGISAYAGVDRTAAVGFTIGADTDVNASGETIAYIAIGPDV